LHQIDEANEESGQHARNCPFLVGPLPENAQN
jgi:hypothetical protein